MKAETLFSRYAHQLHFLKENSILKNTVLKYDDTYICPICLRQFSRADLSPSSPNQLTIEHAPPGATGGKPVALLCKQCNNESGSAYDKHLVERLLEIDRLNLVSGTDMAGKITYDNGASVNATSTSRPDGLMRIAISLKRNSPSNINEFKRQLKIGSNATFEPRLISDSHKMSVALLKAAYMLAFARFGYSFLLDGVYDGLRKQLLNPNIVSYPKGAVIDRIPAGIPEGIHQVTEPTATGLWSVFVVTTRAGTSAQSGELATLMF